jgi:WD repeat-containing protein 68
MPENSGNAPGPPQGYLPSTAPPAANSSFDAPRHRAPTLPGGRTNEELHISTSVAQHAAVPSSAAAQQMYNSPDNYRSAPNINIDQGTPQTNPYGPPTVPGSLQPAGGSGQQQRPGPSNAYTAPVVPTQTQIASNAQQYTLPTRSNTISQASPHSAHSYSRSSPAGLGPEQKYIPFSNTPEQSKYAAGTPAQKYYPSTPSGAASHSPLGLADIRPRANSSMDQEGGMGHGSTMLSDGNKVPSNSNYLAPWSIYAYDWCKWNVPGGNSAGKMAVGSYLEDNHNFVRGMPTGA